MTWDNIPKKDNLEGGDVYLEELETKLLKDDCEATTVAMRPPSSSSSARVPQALLLPPPSTSSCEGHVPSGSSYGFGHGCLTMQEETPS